MDFLASLVEEQLLQEEGPEVLSCISSTCLAAVPRFLLVSYSYYFCEDTSVVTRARSVECHQQHMSSAGRWGVSGGGPALMRMLFYLVDDLQNEKDLCSVPQAANATLGVQGAGARTARKSGGESRGSGHNNNPRQRGQPRIMMFVRERQEETGCMCCVSQTFRNEKQHV